MSLFGRKQKDILPKSVKDKAGPIGWMERAHEEGMRPVDVVPHLCPRQECDQGLDGKD